MVCETIACESTQQLASISWQFGGESIVRVQSLTYEHNSDDPVMASRTQTSRFRIQHGNLNAIAFSVTC